MRVKFEETLERHNCSLISCLMPKWLWISECFRELRKELDFKATKVLRGLSMLLREFLKVFGCLKKKQGLKQTWHLFIRKLLI
jgi:hypothetical protein